MGLIEGNAGLERRLFTDEHEMFRATVRAFVEAEIVPHHNAWEKAGKVDKEMFRAAGDCGLLGMSIPEEFGGGGVNDFRFNVVINEEIQRAGVCGSGFCITLHNDICLPYFLHLADPGQQRRWLPALGSGEAMAALAMTEPQAGSDLAGLRTTAMRDGDCYIVNGAKTFITNGINSDLVITAVRTNQKERHRGLSLLVIDSGLEGFTRGRNLDKIGLKSQDTAELFFDDVKVPVGCRLGEEGDGFAGMMNNLPQERLSIAVTAVAHARTAYRWTIAYCREREAFGRAIGDFQHNRFRLAELKTELLIAQVFVDRLTEDLNSGSLKAESAAAAKWWTTELQQRVVSLCLQLHGGYGYMTEYPIARAYVDARVQTVYAGSTEIMKEIVSRDLDLD